MAGKSNNHSRMARSPSHRPGQRRAKLDPFDRAILRVIQRDNKTPQRAIAEAVNLSAAAVQRRIAAMEAAGIITANTAVVDTAALGLAITAIVEVHLVDERAATVERDVPRVLLALQGVDTEAAQLTHRRAHSAVRDAFTPGKPGCVAGAAAAPASAGRRPALSAPRRRGRRARRSRRAYLQGLTR